MKALFLGLLLLGSCSAVAQDSTPLPPVSTPTITGSGNQARRFKIRLTLTAPDDLKVRESDIVVLGQIIADRVKDRTRLQFQRDGLVRKIGRLQQLAVMPVPPVRSLPDTDYAEEAANIEQVRQKAVEKSKQREQQRRKLDVLANMEQSELPESVIPHETLLLEQQQRDENTAQAEVQLTLGKLSKAKEFRQDKEYNHSLEISKRAIAIKESELKTQGQIADLEARLSQVEISLSRLSAVRSPYSGRIQKIKFVGQSDQNLSVELTLLVSGDTSSVGTISPSEKATDSTTGDRERIRPAPRVIERSEVTPEETDKKSVPSASTEQLGEGEINPLNPAGNSLDNLIKLRISDDLWKGLLGDLPCLETQEACIKNLQGLAVKNSRSLKAIDERVKIIDQKINEARRNNQRTINLSVFEPLVQSYLKIDTVTQPNGTVQKNGFFNKVLGIFSGISGINEVLSLVGIPLFRNLGGGDAAAQQRTIAIGDLQVKLAEIENKRGDLADKIKEAVIIQVLDFDVARKDFQVSQEIARREVTRGKLREVDYRYSTALTTDGYLSSLSSLDRSKADSFRQWARLRSQLARIKILVLGEGQE